MRKLLAVALMLAVCSPVLAQRGGGSRGGSSSFGGGGRSYSSGGSSYKPSSSSYKPSSSSSSKPSSSASKPSYTSSGGKGYTFGTGSTSTSRKAASTGVDAAAAQAQKSDESRANYQKSRGYTENTPSYGVKKAYPAKQVEALRNLPPDKVETRAAREQTVYHQYYSTPPPASTGNFNPYFWLWLMDRPVIDRTRWAYHHRSEISDAQYADLLKQDADLEKKLKQMEADGVQREETFAPPGIDADLQYADSYVRAARAPSFVAVAGKLLLWFLCLVVGIIVVFLWAMFVYWLIFVKEFEHDWING